MPKAWLHTKLSEMGFSPIEVLLAATAFGFLAVGLIGAIVYSQQSTANAGDRARAAFLAEEGIQAVRNIRDNAFTNVTDGTFGITQAGNQWVLSGTSDITGIYTRQLAVTSNGADRKNITATVNWPSGSGTSQVSVSSLLTNWSAAIAPTITPGPIMMAYSKTTTTPFYRIWNGTSWGAEASAQNVVGNINYVVLKSARTRNEAILGVQTSTGAIYVQIWNGTSWGNLTQVGTGSTTTRGFDISYERNSDKAVIAYSPSSISVDFAYRTWNGTTLSSATIVTAPPTLGTINWIELDSNPLSTSNELSMIMSDNLSAIYGMTWSGSAWNAMGQVLSWDGMSASANKKTIDVEYEQTSGKALFIWGDSIATDQYYRTWNGTTLSSATLLDIATEGGVAEWVQLAARPNSNEIMLAVQDAGADLNTRKWSGSAWDTATQHPEHSATVENITSRVFDIIWETHPNATGRAWIVWGDSLTITAKVWSSGSWIGGSALTGSDDTSFVRLRTDPVSGTVFAGLYEDATSTNDDIWETRLTGGTTTWSARNTIWAGPTGTTPVYFRIDIATP